MGASFWRRNAEPVVIFLFLKNTNRYSLANKAASLLLFQLNSAARLRELRSIFSRIVPR